MARAVCHGTVIAESDYTIQVEGNHYFPPSSVKQEYLKESDTHTTCPWKGVASYYHAVVNGQEYQDVAWRYPEATDEAKRFEGYFAFWRDVQVED